MSSSAIVLYSDSRYLSPYVMSVFVALKEKGLRCELVPVDLAEHENRQEAYAAVSLTCRVPTLLLDGFDTAGPPPSVNFLMKPSARRIIRRSIRICVRRGLPPARCRLAAQRSGCAAL